MADTCYDPKTAYLPGSFKGASLGQIMECESDHGRRGAEGEFPFGEDTSYADLGRRIRLYRVKGQFPRSSHVADAGALIAACESPNPGTLVHPTRGVIQAACKHLKVIDSPEDAAGVTVYEAHWVEANDAYFSLLAGLLSSVLPFDLSGVLAAAQNAFAGGYAIDGLAYYDVPTAVGVAQGAVSAVATSFGRVVGITVDPNVTRIRNDLAACIRTDRPLRSTLTCWQAISNGIAAIDRYGADIVGKIEAHRAVINWGSQAASAPVAAIKNTVYSTARIIAAAYLANAAAAASSKTMTSQDLSKYYGMIVQVMREEMLAARLVCNDELYMALNDFLVQAQTVLLRRIYSAPVVVEYNFGYGVFSQVAAHEIYADGTRFAEIEARNPYSPPYHIGPSVTAVRA